MKLIFRYLRPLSRTLAFGLTVKMLATLFELTLPYILSYILDEIVPKGEISLILIWGAVMIVAAVLAMTCNVIANRNASGVARDASRAIRHDLFAATMHLSSRQADAFTVPSLESRLTSDTYNVHQFLRTLQVAAIRVPILLLGGIAITLVLDWRLALVLIAALPLIGGSVYLVTRRGLPLFRRTQTAVDNMVRVVREDCQGVRVIKALSREAYEIERFDNANSELIARERRAKVTMAASQPLMTLFLNIGLVAVIVTGVYLVNGNLSSPGRIIAFIQYFTLMSGAMTAMTRIFTMSTRSTASANRIAEILEAGDTSRRTDTKALAADDARYIVFDDVCFSYGGKKNNLDHVSFTLPKGGTLGVIGATGSGKTTLATLLMRFYDIDSGSILIGGEDIYAMDSKRLHGLFGVVMQNDFIIADSIAENIRFGRDIPMDDVRRAARIAQAADFIEAFPDGFEHQLTAKGTNVSGGQRQRILIARALAGNPDILVLDDASSALDYKTDAALRTAIREELADTTTVIVTQRVSSVKHADYILVLDHGCVIGAGRHEELLESCAAYREISDSQMGGAFLD